MVAPRIGLPALVLLLPAGFLLGMAASWTDARLILGDSFGPVIDVVVAVILFRGGMDLGRRPIGLGDTRVALRLVWFGGLITWGAGAFAIWLVVGIPWDIALLLGAILAVSGPTVVGPLLRHARVTRRVGDTLTWESLLLDPVGALAAVIVFQALRAGNESDVLAGVLAFLEGIGVAAIGTAAGVAFVWIGLRLAGSNHVAGTTVMLAAVVLGSGIASAMVPNAGLLTALAMGAVVERISVRVRHDVDAVLPFFDTVESIAIGVLFVSLAALVSPGDLGPVILATLVVVTLMVLVVRPLVAFAFTVGGGFSWRERLFIGWMAPRGIVAAATAASMATSLIRAGTPGADLLLPVAFVVIAGTVFIYGFTGSPAARLLGLRSAQEEDG